MSVKRQWKVMKLAGLPIDEEVRKELVEGILRHKKPKISLFAWNVSSGIAEEAFFSSREAVNNWYVSQKIWEKNVIPKGIIVHTWKTNVDDILQHTANNSVRNISLTESQEIQVGISPSELHEELQQTLGNQL